MKKTSIGLLLLLHLACFSCRSGKTATACIDEAKANPDQVCTMQYAPVCGCDGKTYGNACEADRAGVTAFTQGACTSNN